MAGSAEFTTCFTPASIFRFQNTALESPCLGGGGAWQEFPTCCRLFMITMKSPSGRTCIQLVLVVRCLQMPSFLCPALDSFFSPVVYLSFQTCGDWRGPSCDPRPMLRGGEGVPPIPERRFMESVTACPQPLLLKDGVAKQAIRWCGMSARRHSTTDTCRGPGLRARCLDRPHGTNGRGCAK